jgi:hypothetical protein
MLLLGVLQLLRLVCRAELLHAKTHVLNLGT